MRKSGDRNKIFHYFPFSFTSRFQYIVRPCQISLVGTTFICESFFDAMSQAYLSSLIESIFIASWNNCVIFSFIANTKSCLLELLHGKCFFLNAHKTIDSIATKLSMLCYCPKNAFVYTNEMPIWTQH